MYKEWQAYTLVNLILKKISKIGVTDQMSDFKAKMHQNRLRLRLRPKPRWGACSTPPDPLAVFKGAYF